MSSDVTTQPPSAATGRPRVQTWVARLTIWRALRTIAIAVTLLVLAGATLARLVEPETFDDFGLACWWAVETVTTVGYGDIVPSTTPGRVVGAVLMIGGVSMIPLVTSIVVSVLAAKQAQEENRLEVEQLEALRAQLARLEEQLKR